MWWPRSKHALMFVHASTLHTRVRTPYGNTWCAIDPIPLTARTPSALSSAIEEHLHEIKPRSLELALNWDWAPGIVVDFGTMPMPRAAGDALARLRMRETFGAEAADWTLIQDSKRFSGPRSVFGISPAVIDATRSVAHGCGVRLRRIEPTLAWSWRAFKRRSVQSCWWIVDHEHGLTIAQVRQGVPRSIDYLPIDDSPSASELERSIAQLGIRRAVTDASTLPMRWVQCDGLTRDRIPARALVKCLRGSSPIDERAT